MPVRREVNAATLRRVLIVSPFFPPSNLAGVHRARHLAKFLPAFGWTVTVLSVHPDDYEQALDYDLATLVPRSARMRYVRAAPAWLTRLLGIGDISLRAWSSLSRALRDEVARGVDVVLVTISPNFPAIMAARVARSTGVPLVLDYQDPWVRDVRANVPWWSKSRAAQCIARLMEPRALRWASQITSVSEGTNELIRKRYPTLPRKIFSVMPIGVDPDDFDHIGNESREPKEEQTITLRYVGTIWPSVMETLDAFFASLALLKLRSPLLYARLRIDFIGTTYGPAGSERPQVLELAKRHGIEASVREWPARVPYLGALAAMKSATVILAFGSHEAHYTASKAFLCLLAGPPVLAFFHEHSSVCDIVNAAGRTVLVTFSTEERAGAKATMLASALNTMLVEPDSVPSFQGDALVPYLAATMAGEFADVLERAADQPIDEPWW